MMTDAATPSRGTFDQQLILLRRSVQVFLAATGYRLSHDEGRWLRDLLADELRHAWVD